MRFGPLAVDEAVGALAAHSLRADGAVIRKGATISAEDAARLKAAGIETITAVRLDPGDVGEDQAALRLARAVAGAEVRVEKPFTGRSNLYATRAGLLMIDKDVVDSLNGIDEAITFATLPAYKPVVQGEMIGTVKIIPYAVAGAVLQAGLAVAARGAALAVAPYARGRVGAISTLTPGLKPSVVAKTIRVLGERLAPSGATLVAQAMTPHETAPLAEALTLQVESGAELVVVFGASAIADRRDVIPAAIEQAGGEIEHFGMPVDPGNLLLVGRIGTTPVIGAPGCARSPKENGFDWVLQRLLAGIPVTRADITALGVGGLLMEIVSRGQPRGGGEPHEEGEEHADG
jgi:molybdenum cofactor cytidylyltransferase